MTRKTKSNSSLSSLPDKTGNPDELKMKKSNKDTKSLDGSVVKEVKSLQEQGAENTSLQDMSKSIKQFGIVKEVGAESLSRQNKIDDEFSEDEEFFDAVKRVMDSDLGGNGQNK